MTENEKIVAMGWWIRGMFAGASPDSRKVLEKNGDYKFLRTAVQVTGAGAYNPIHIAEMIIAAKRLGFPPAMSNKEM